MEGLRKPKNSERIDHIPEIPAAAYEAAYKIGWLEKARRMNPNFVNVPKTKRGRKPKNSYGH